MIRKNAWNDFNFLKIYQGYIYDPGCDLFWRMFRVHLRKRWNSLFWGEMSYRFQLVLTGPLYHLKCVSLLILLVDLFISVCEVVKSPPIDHYVVSFFVSFHGLYFKVYFIWVLLLLFSYGLLFCEISFSTPSLSVWMCP